MELSTLQSLNAYAKDMELQAQWDIKKESVDHGPGKISDEQEEEQPKKTKSKPLDHTLQLIETKLASGKAPTAEEMAYLKEQDPDGYIQAEQVEQARTAYEEDLKNCISEEDVKFLKMSKLSASIAAVESIKNNPLIAPEKKLQYIVTEHQKAAAINRMTKNFIKSGEYRVPTPEEKAEIKEKHKLLQKQLRIEGDPVSDEDELEAEEGAAEDSEVSEELARKVKQAKAKAFYLLYADVYADNAGAEEVVLPAQRMRGTASLDTKA